MNQAVNIEAEARSRCDEVDLVSEIAAGKRRSEERLVRKYRPQLVCMLIKLTQDPHRAEDIAQETLIVVIEKLRNGAIRKPDLLTSFIYSTARYIYYGWLRKLDNQVELREGMDDVISPETEPETAIQGYEDLAVVHELIGQLPVQRDREVLSRHYIYDQTKPEICEALELSLNHYDRVISRARSRLKRPQEHRCHKAAINRTTT